MSLRTIVDLDRSLDSVFVTALHVCQVKTDMSLSDSYDVNFSSAARQGQPRGQGQAQASQLLIPENDGTHSRE
jgi:hypothetical protein